jgi:Zn-finger nucleic acid-binding protein
MYGNTFYDMQTSKFQDIRDLIKACPHCGLIWMKTLGCNKITCGKKVVYKDNHYQKNMYRHLFTINNGMLTY